MDSSDSHASRARVKSMSRSKVGNGEIPHTADWSQIKRCYPGRNLDLVGNGYISCLEIRVCSLDSKFLRSQSIIPGVSCTSSVPALGLQRWMRCSRSVKPLPVCVCVCWGGVGHMGTLQWFPVALLTLTFSSFASNSWRVEKLLTWDDCE